MKIAYFPHSLLRKIHEWIDTVSRLTMVFVWLTHLIFCTRVADLRSTGSACSRTHVPVDCSAFTNTKLCLQAGAALMRDETACPI